LIQRLNPDFFRQTPANDIPFEINGNNQLSVVPVGHDIYFIT
jgi:hypothetical protein